MIQKVNEKTEEKIVTLSLNHGQQIAQTITSLLCPLGTWAAMTSVFVARGNSLLFLLIFNLKSSSQSLAVFLLFLFQICEF